MASKIDKSFIENLQNFTDSLENLVDLLKTNFDKGGDSTNNMSAAMDGEKLKTISEDMKLLVETSKSVDSRTKEILAEVKAAKKAKEGGVFSKISDKDNKNKVVDGVKVILLIAMGVLAIGMAFKIVGQVDPMSVIALGIAMYAISKSFEAIANIKGLTYKKAAMVGGIMVILSMALLMSSMILKWVSPIDIITGFSIIFISATLGIMTYMLLKGLEKIDLTKPKVLKNVLLSPIILPMISLAIVLSSFILQYTQPLGFKEALSALFISVILGVVAFLLLKGLEKVDLSKPGVMKNVLLSPIILPMIALAIVASSYVLQHTQNVSFKQGMSAMFVGAVLGVTAYLLLKGLSSLNLSDPKVLIAAFLSPILLPLIALSIVLSSKILQDFVPLKDPLTLIGNSIAIGISMVIFGGVIVAFTKLKVGLGDIISGSLGMLAMSLSIVGVSKILQMFTPIKDPISLISSSIAIGVSMFVFGGIISAFTKLNVGLTDIIKGSLGIIVISGSIVATSLILSMGKYGIYPSLGWSLGVGLSIGAFSLSAIALGMIASTGVGALSIVVGAAMVLLVAASIVATSKILSMGKYNNAPPIGWAISMGILLPVVGASLMFLGGIGLLGGGLLLVSGIAMLIGVSKAIVTASKILSTGTYTGGPSKQWAEGVAISIGAFANALDKSMNAGKSLVGKIFGGQSGISGDDFVLFIDGVSKAIVTASKILSTGTYTGGPSKQWSEGVGTAIGAFASALDSSLNAGKSTLQKFFGGGSSADITTFIENVSLGIKKAGEILSGGVFTGGPDATWSRNVATSILAFSKALISADTAQYNGTDFSNFIQNVSIGMVKASRTLSQGKWENAPSDSWTNAVNKSVSAMANISKSIGDPQIESMNTFATAIKNLAESFSQLNDSGISKLSSFSGSLNVISTINPEGFTASVTAIDQNKGKLQGIANSIGNNSSYSVSTPVKQPSVDTNFMKNNSSSIKLETGDVSGRLDKILGKMETIITSMVKSSKTAQAGQSDSPQ